MKTKISAADLGRNLSDVLSRVHDQGETFVVERDGEAVATIEPTPEKKAVTWSMLAADFRDASFGDPSFADDLEMIQRTQLEAHGHPWPN